MVRSFLVGLALVVAASVSAVAQCGPLGCPAPTARTRPFAPPVRPAASAALAPRWVYVIDLGAYRWGTIRPDGFFVSAGGPAPAPAQR